MSHGRFIREGGPACRSVPVREFRVAALAADHCPWLDRERRPGSVRLERRVLILRALGSRVGGCMHDVTYALPGSLRPVARAMVAPAVAVPVHIALRAWPPVPVYFAPRAWVTLRAARAGAHCAACMGRR